MRWYRFVKMGIVMGIFILTVAGGALLSLRTRIDQHIILPNQNEQPDMRIQNVHLTEQAEDGNEWKLWAHEAEFYDAKQVVVVRQLQAQLLSDAAQPLHVIADHGKIDKATGNMTIQGNVQLQYLADYIITTDVLYWDAASRILRTDAAIKIDSALVHIAGIGLLGNVSQQQFILQDDVHAAFQIR